MIRSILMPIAACAALLSFSTVAPAAPVNAPTIVLVHGAIADNSSWNGVIGKLTEDGYRVVAAANPLRGVKSDADEVSSLVKSIAGPVVLVGHSYGGMVITNAANGNANVKALVYVAAFAPDAGESAGDLIGHFPGSTLGQTLAPPVVLTNGDKDLFVEQDKFWQQFGADVPQAQARLMAVDQRPLAASAFGEAAATPAWKTIPASFIYGSLDKCIPPATHKFMAERAGAKKTIEIAGGSHLIMVSHAAEVASLIEAAAGN